MANEFPEWGALLGWAATLMLASYNLIKFIISRDDKKHSSRTVSPNEVNGKDRELRDELRDDIRRVEKRFIDEVKGLRAEVAEHGRELAVVKALRFNAPKVGSESSAKKLEEGPAVYTYTKAAPSK